MKPAPNVPIPLYQNFNQYGNQQYNNQQYNQYGNQGFNHQYGSNNNNNYGFINQNTNQNSNNKPRPPIPFVTTNVNEVIAKGQKFTS
mgnify:CR=1 FL=1